MPEYSHTLIPDRVEFVPDPEQVGNFLSSLVSIGAAPLKPAVAVSKPSGEVQTFLNPFTGATDSLAVRKATKLSSLAAVPGALNSLDDYDVTLTGKGPPKLPAFTFDFKGSYDFLIHCCLRAEVVSTSDWHDEIPITQKVEPFGQPCSPQDRIGIYHNPNTLKVIEVPNAGCARFWIEFEFGKMLFPPIEDRLDLIDPQIVETAQMAFGVPFLQACCWSA